MENPVSAQSSDRNGKISLILDYDTTDVKAVVEKSQTEMAALGWKQIVSSDLPAGTVTNYSKDDRKCTVSIGPNDGQVKVAIMLSGS